MINVFVDTNFFIQYKKYDALKWTELFQDDVSIIITRTVLREIDNHKNSENKRRSRRARSAVGFIREILDSPKEIRKDGFLLIIKLIEYYDFSQKKSNLLDLAKADDCIVNDVLVWAENNPGKDCCVLTGDINLSITCRDCGVQCYELLDTWRLPPETDDRDNKIKALKKELESLRGKSPILNVVVDKEIYDVDLMVFSKLSDAEVEEISEKIFEAFPEKYDFSNDMTKTEKDKRLEAISQMTSPGGIYGQKGTWYLPTNEQIKEYHEKYVDWKRELIASLKRLPGFICNDISIFPLKFSLENKGTAPAEDVHVKIFVSSNMLILPEDKEERKIPFGRERIDFPQMPFPPQKKYIDNKAQIISNPFFTDRLISPQIPKSFIPREIGKFYWEPEKPMIPVQVWEFSCPEFRHQIAKEDFDLDILVPESGVNGELYVEISVYSRQLTTPIVKKVPVRPRRCEGNFYQRVLKSVEGYIRQNNKKSNDSKL